MTPRIIAFVDARYIPVAQNWLLALQEIGLGEKATLVTLDEEARVAFPAGQVMHRPLGEVSLSALWLHRIAVFEEVLRAGEAFIHSDVDAVWLSDPLHHIMACDAEAVFSQGTVWPPDVHERHGVVLCCGFFYLSATPATLQFLEKVAVRVREDRDDQVAVNRVVALGVDGWQIEGPYEIPFRETTFQASRRPMRAIRQQEGSRLPSLAVLPHHAFSRLIDRMGPDVVVAHPLSGKTCQDKRNCLGELGLWKLTEVPER